MYIFIGSSHKGILRTVYGAVLRAVYSVCRNNKNSVENKPVPPGTFIFINSFVSSTVHSKE